MYSYILLHCYVLNLYFPILFTAAKFISAPGDQCLQQLSQTQPSISSSAESQQQQPRESLGNLAHDKEAISAVTAANLEGLVTDMASSTPTVASNPMFTYDNMAAGAAAVLPGIEPISRTGDQTSRESQGSSSNDNNNHQTKTDTLQVPMPADSHDLTNETSGICDDKYQDQHHHSSNNNHQQHSGAGETSSVI